MSEKIGPNSNQVERVTQSKQRADQQTLFEQLALSAEGEGSNKNDPLSMLWQQQNTETPDISTLKSKWNSVKLKQKYYFALDLLGVVFIFSIAAFGFEKLGEFGRIWMVLMVILTIAFVAYFSWLRRFALNWSSEATESHILSLREQYKSSIKIANANKHFVWFGALASLVFFVGIVYFGETQVDKLMSKIPYIIGTHLIFGPSIWFWANNRAKRFERELNMLNKLVG